MKKFTEIEFDKNTLEIIIKDNNTEVDRFELKKNEWLKAIVIIDASVPKIRVEENVSEPSGSLQVIRIRNEDNVFLEFRERKRNSKKYWSAAYIGIVDERPGRLGAILDLEDKNGVYFKLSGGTGDIFTHFESVMIL